MTWSVAFGLALLYVSAYFLPLLNAVQSYFVPSVWTYVVAPSAVGVAVLAPTAVIAARAIERARWTRVRLFVTWLVLSTLAFIALSSLIASADYSIDNVIALILQGKDGTMNDVRWLRVLLTGASACIVMVLVWVFRARSREIARFLSALGFAFAILAAFHIGKSARV